MNYIVLIQTVISLAKMVEQAMPQSSGKDKFDAVITALNSIFGDIVTLAPQIASIINTLVGELTRAGVFTKKTS